MRKAALATAVLVIVFLMEPLIQLTVVEANPYSFPPWSPQPGLYLTPNVQISLHYYRENYSPQISSFSFTLDKEANSTLSFTTMQVNMTVYNRNSPSPPTYVEATKYSVSKTVENLPNGDHTIVVYAYFSDGKVKSIMDTTFTVDTTLNPVVNLISPLNETTYNINEVPLTYTTNSKVQWSYYSIDSNPSNSSGLKNFNGNITLSSLSEGKHELNVYVTANIAQDLFPSIHHTIIFYVDTAAPASTQPSDPTSILPEFPAVLAITFLFMAALAVVVYRRKNR